MKKLILLLATVMVAFSSYSQNTIAELKISPNVVTTDINGGAIEKDDTIQVALVFKNNNSNLRNFYLDFQHQISAINMIGVVFPTAGTEAIPTGTQTSFTNNYYPGYNWFDNANNNTEDGLQNAYNAQYNYVQGQTRAINRVNITTATPNGNATPLNDGILCYLRFKVVNVAAGFAYDSIYYNFAYGWDNAGQQKSIKMPKPNSAWVNLDPSLNALIHGVFQINTNLPESIRPTVAITDSATSVLKASRLVGTSNNFNLSSELLPNTTYYATAHVPSDSVHSILTRAITVSDYTAAQNEFIKQNLDGTFTKTIMTSGMSFFAADMNQNQKFDGGDLALLFAQAVGADSVYGPQANSSTTNFPIFLASYFDTVSVNTALQLTSTGMNSFKVKFKTKDVADSLKIKYIIPGDVNRSHSSKVVVGGQTINTSRNSFILPGLSSAAYGYNSTAQDISYIDVSLKNITVTSNTIEIPVNLDTKGINTSALQFEFVYDKTKVKFDDIKSELPNSWYVFANSKDGKIRFGAIDKDLKTPVTGSLVPFKLKFTALENGLDLNTKIQITLNLDASDKNGNQLGINLNTQTIKLTGYNNFN
jgi:hypothetical protein